MTPGEAVARKQRGILDDTGHADVSVEESQSAELDRALTFWLPLTLESAAAGEPCAFTLRFDGTSWSSTVSKIGHDDESCRNCGAIFVEDYRSDCRCGGAA